MSKDITELVVPRPPAKHALDIEMLMPKSRIVRARSMSATWYPNGEREL